MKKRIVLIFLIFFIFNINFSSLSFTYENLSSVEISRLVAVCKLWGFIKFFHPYMGYKDIDWDQALINFLESSYSIAVDNEFQKKVEIMLKVLNDPITKVVRINSKSEEEVSKKNLLIYSLYSMTSDNFLIITIRKPKELDNLYYKKNILNEIKKKCSEANGILFDLRAIENFTEDDNSFFTSIFRRSNIFKMMFSGFVYPPCERFQTHWGFQKERGTSGVYYSSFNVIQSKGFDGSNEVIKKPIVFLVNKKSMTPFFALALQNSGKAIIVAEDGINEASVVRTMNVKLSENLTTRIKTGEIVNFDGSIGVEPDIVISENKRKSDKDHALIKAFELLRNFNISRKINKGSMPLPRLFKAKRYEKMVFPPEEYRLLAVFKAWNIINHFFPYKHLMERDWEDVLREFIPRIISVRDEIEYILTLSEMLTHLHDSHVYIRSETLTKHFGEAFPPFLCRMIEDKPVIIKILDVDLEKKDIISLGDIILKINRVGINVHIKRYSKFIAASTPQSKMFIVLDTIFRGPNNSIINLTVESKSGKIKNVKLVRKVSYKKKRWNTRKGKIIKLISDDIGYVDLHRLTVPMVDDMFEALKNTKSIIFDMRGYPRGTAWHIAPRLTDKKSVSGASIKGVLKFPSDYIYYKPATIHYKQLIPESNKWKYKGKTVMLIDERTISQAEHTGLFFEMANNTKFIGSPSMGANGDVTNFYLPGDLLVSFTGVGVYHADGRQLQRKGLIPHMEVKPTIKGIRDGRDEVLERAIGYLKNELEK